MLDQSHSLEAIPEFVEIPDVLDESLDNDMHHFINPDAEDAESLSEEIEDREVRYLPNMLFPIGNRQAVDLYLDTCLRSIPNTILENILKVWITRLRLPSTLLESGEFLLIPPALNSNCLHLRDLPRLAVEIIHLVTQFDLEQSRPQISFTILQLQILTGETLAGLKPQLPDDMLKEINDYLRRCFVVARKVEELEADEIGIPYPFQLWNLHLTLRR
jgi:hypothetical protein